MKHRILNKAIYIPLLIIYIVKLPSSRSFVTSNKVIINDF
jgi:hypothetical protein